MTLSELKGGGYSEGATGGIWTVLSKASCEKSLDGAPRGRCEIHTAPGSAGYCLRQPRLALMASVSFGMILLRSPTTPRSENSKIGAFGSLLIATMFSEFCIPTLC